MLRRFLVDCGGIAIILALLSGCAVMSEEECLQTNWHKKGYEDGIQGVGSHMLGEYIDSCKKYKPVETEAYRNGRQEGANIYCSNDAGYNLGTQGTAVSDICQVSNNLSGFNEYYRRGKLVYDANEIVRKIDKNISFYNNVIADNRFYTLLYQFDANRAYLYNSRNSAMQYLDYINANAYDGNILNSAILNYEQFNQVPYPLAYSTATNAKKWFDEADKAFYEIDKRIDDIDSELNNRKVSKDRQKILLNKRNCLFKASYNVKKMVEKLTRDLNRIPRNQLLNYYNCY
ncbi:MAG: DUF2799 domain-containing protein [Succinivibrionaceae bacterium]